MREQRRARKHAALVVGALLVVAAPAAADTRLISRTPAGGLPNAPSSAAAVSQDRKAATFIAYDSAASDIVAGDANGLRDVFVVRRAGGNKAGAKKGKPWKPGTTELVTRGAGGEPADGASFGADLDGDQLHRSHCVAFLSDATNLVPGDSNGKTDAFVKDLSSGKVTRVSVNSRGEQADGATYDVQVDGACDRVAFTSDATNLAFTADQLPPPRTIDSPLTGSERRRCRKRTPKKPCKTKPVKVKSQRAPAVTTAPAPGTRQVYVRVLGGERADKGLVGLTFLASASAGGEPGNGNSFDAAFGDLGSGCPKACGTTTGDALAFTSEASNLVGGDGDGTPDVYLRSFRIPTQHFRERRAGLPAYMELKTVLVSGAASGAADQPAVNSAGDAVAFRSGGTNIVYADLSRGRTKLKTVTPGGNGPSSTPALSRNGLPMLFATDATNLTSQPDGNCVSDVLVRLRKRSFIESLDSSGTVAGSCPAPAGATGAQNPALSYLANYAVFEDSRPLAPANAPGGDPHQIYEHFIGP